MRGCWCWRERVTGSSAPTGRASRERSSNTPPQPGDEPALVGSFAVMDGPEVRRGALNRVWAVALVVGGMLVLAPAASAGDQTKPLKDYSQTALNIIPSGQYGTVPTPPGA